MKISIEPKSLAVGLLSGLCLALVLRAGAQPAPPAAQPAPPCRPEGRLPNSRSPRATPGRRWCWTTTRTTFYIFESDIHGAWTIRTGFNPAFNITQQLAKLHKRSPIRIDPAATGDKPQ